MFIKLDASGLWWPETDSASLHVKVCETSYSAAEPIHKVFHERRLEVLPEGGDPAALLRGMATFAIERWRKLILMYPPF